MDEIRAEIKGRFKFFVWQDGKKYETIIPFKYAIGYIPNDQKSIEHGAFSSKEINEFLDGDDEKFFDEFEKEFPIIRRLILGWAVDGDPEALWFYDKEQDNNKADVKLYETYPDSLSGWSLLVNFWDEDGNIKRLVFPPFEVSIHDTKHFCSIQVDEIIDLGDQSFDDFQEEIETVTSKEGAEETDLEVDYSKKAAFEKAFFGETGIG